MQGVTRMRNIATQIITCKPSSLIQTVLSVPELHRVSCQRQVADCYRR